MNKISKKIIVALCVALVAVIAVSGFVANVFLGNPFTKNKAEKAAIVHLEEKYPEHKFEIVSVIYNWKSCNYTAQAKLLNSTDDTVIEVCYGENECRDDYSWQAVSRLSKAAEAEIKPALVEEFGENSNPEIVLADFHKLSESADISLDQPIDFDNFPYAVDIDVNILTNESDKNAVTADAMKRIDAVVNGRFTVANYMIDIYSADGTEMIDSVLIKSAETLK